MSEPPATVVSQPQPPAPVTAGEDAPALPTACANCGATLAGEYCATCGQRNEPHVHSLRHFASEAFESITHADSRLWRTLWFLLAKPGLLTREFFAGRRASYLPPFRLYLVLSVILVMLSSLATRSDEPPAAENAAPAATLPAPAATETQPEGLAPAQAPGELAIKKPVVQIDGLDDFCAAFEGPDDGEGNVSGRQNVRRFCRRIRTEPGELAEAVVHSIPRAMFVFLPLIAALMKLMYWRPKRYYVEHLLFLVHNHAAVYLIYSLVALVSFIPVIGDFTPLFFFAALGYLAWYIYRAMRTVYAQGKLLTLTKYFLLLWIYLATAISGFLLTMVLIAIWG